jgi:hypothetical protein
MSRKSISVGLCANHWRTSRQWHPGANMPVATSCLGRFQ